MGAQLIDRGDLIMGDIGPTRQRYDVLPLRAAHTGPRDDPRHPAPDTQRPDPPAEAPLPPDSVAQDRRAGR